MTATDKLTAEENDNVSANEQPRSNLTERVHGQLLDLFISGELRPGDYITERRMADRLKASRTPIREALGRLEAEGLVYKRTGRGVTVSSFSTEVFVDILNIRQILEAEAAWLAAGAISRERIAEIREALRTLSQNPDPTLLEIWQADDLLHGAIADAAGNALMATMIRDLRRRTHVFNVYRDTISPYQSAVADEHLLSAVESGDRQRARDTMAQHIQAVKIALIQRLSGISLEKV